MSIFEQREPLWSRKMCVDFAKQQRNDRRHSLLVGAQERLQTIALECNVPELAWIGSYFIKSKPYVLVFGLVLVVFCS